MGCGSSSQPPPAKKQSLPVKQSNVYESQKPFTRQISKKESPRKSGKKSEKILSQPQLTTDSSRSNFEKGDLIKSAFGGTPDFPQEGRQRIRYTSIYP